MRNKESVKRRAGEGKGVKRVCWGVICVLKVSSELEFYRQ